MSRLVVLACSMLALALGLCVPARSHAAPDDLVITVPADLTLETVEAAMGDFIVDEKPEFAWLRDQVRVELSGVSDTIVHFRLNLAFLGIVGELAGFPMAIDADLRVNCDASGPSLVVGAVTATPVDSLPDDLLTDMRKSANELIAARTSDIVDPLWDALRNFDLGDVRQVCPQVTTTPSGDIRASFDFENGCINGRTRHTNCGAGFFGNGTEHVCRNGRWVLEYRDCDRRGV
jgi:hypothetical protein